MKEKHLFFISFFLASFIFLYSFRFPEEKNTLDPYNKITQHIFKILEKEELTGEDLTKIKSLTSSIPKFHSPPYFVLESGSGVEEASYIYFTTMILLRIIMLRMG